MLKNVLSFLFKKSTTIFCCLMVYLYLCSVQILILLIMVTNNQIVALFDTLNGAKFIGINNYNSSTGELSNIVLNTNISTTNAKKRDLIKLQSLTENDINNISLKYNINIDTVKLNLDELIQSLIKNSGDFEGRTEQSKAITNAYDQNNNGTKFLLNDGVLVIYGFVIQKKVIIAGDEVVKPSKGKTFVKNSIKEYAKLSMNKYRTYKLSNIMDCIVLGKNRVVINM